LIASIEGAAAPQAQAPYPAVSGLWGKPTLINNVETYANIAPIVRNGRQVVCQHGIGAEQGHQGLRPPAKSPTPVWLKCPWHQTPRNH